MIDKEEFTVSHSLHKQGHRIRAISKILNLNSEKEFVNGLYN